MWILVLWVASFIFPTIAGFLLSWKIFLLLTVLLIVLIYRRSKVSFEDGPFVPVFSALFFWGFFFGWIIKACQLIGPQTLSLWW